MALAASAFLALLGLLLMVVLVGAAFFKLNAKHIEAGPDTSQQAGVKSGEDEDEPVGAPGVRARGAADRMRGGRLRQRAARAAQQEAAVQQAAAARHSEDENSERSEGEDGSDEGEEGEDGKVC